MEEGDAELVEKVVAKGDYLLLKLMDGALALEMEGLRRRLACGVALKVMRCTVEELKEEYGLGESNFEEEGLRNSMRPMIEELRKGYMEEEG